MKEAIIDTTSLRYFTQLNEDFTQYKSGFDIFGVLRLLFRTLHVPMEIKNEFANYDIRSPQASAVLDRIERGNSFLRLCHHYDPIVKASLDTAKIKGIDKGESEALAQSPTIRVPFFITDDQRCIKAVTTHYNHIRCISSLTVLTALDLHKYLYERDKVFTFFIRNYQKISPRKSAKEKSGFASLLRIAYQQAASYYTISLTPKELAHLCSIKRLSL